MPNQEFTVVVEGIPELIDRIMDALFEAGCDDATISMQGGRMSIDFIRSAPTMEDAIAGAIHDVRRSRVGGNILEIGIEVGGDGKTDRTSLRMAGA